MNILQVDLNLYYTFISLKAHSLASIGKYVPGSIESSAGAEKLVIDSYEV